MTDEELKEALARYADLGWYPNKWQTSLHRDLRRFNLLVCHRLFGKTMFSGIEVIDRALRSKGEYAYMTPAKVPGVPGNFFQTKIPGAWLDKKRLELPNGSRVRIYDNYFGHDDKGMQGVDLDGIVLDDVTLIFPGVWQTLMRCLVKKRGWMIFIGSSTGANMLSNLFYGMIDKPDWYVAKFPIAKNFPSWMDEASVAKSRAGMSKRRARQEFDCDFVAPDGYLFVSDGED